MPAKKRGAKAAQALAGAGLYAWEPAQRAGLTSALCSIIMLTDCTPTDSRMIDHAEL
jgi:hypothetical protein